MVRVLYHTLDVNDEEQAANEAYLKELRKKRKPLIRGCKKAKINHHTKKKLSLLPTRSGGLAAYFCLYLFNGVVHSLLVKFTSARGGDSKGRLPPTTAASPEFVRSPRSLLWPTFAHRC